MKTTPTLDGSVFVCGGTIRNDDSFDGAVAKQQNETKYFATFDGPLSEQTRAHLTVVNRENRYCSY